MEYEKLMLRVNNANEIKINGKINFFSRRVKPGKIKQIDKVDSEISINSILYMLFLSVVVVVVDVIEKGIPHYVSFTSITNS